MVVIQACFTVFILPLVSERTIIQRTSCEGTKFSVDVKLPLRSIKPRNLLVSLFSVGFRSKNSERQGIYPCLYACTLKKYVVGYLILTIETANLEYYRCCFHCALFCKDSLFFDFIIFFNDRPSFFCNQAIPRPRVY